MEKVLEGGCVRRRGYGFVAWIDCLGLMLHFSNHDLLRLSTLSTSLRSIILGRNYLSPLSSILISRFSASYYS